LEEPGAPLRKVAVGIRLSFELGFDLGIGLVGGQALKLLRVSRYSASFCMALKPLRHRCHVTAHAPESKGSHR
jgi:hypothetical protein